MWSIQTTSWCYNAKASIVGAVSAVAGIQFIMFAYVIVAYYEEDWKKPEEEPPSKVKSGSGKDEGSGGKKKEK